MGCSTGECIIKVCSCCKLEKDLNNFYNRKTNPDGKDWACKECHIIRNKKYRLENKEKIYQATLEYKTNWYTSNKKRQSEKSKILYQENPEYYKKKSSIYVKNNRNKTNALKAKYKLARKRAIPSWANINKIKDFYINCPKEYHVDHIVPIQGKTVCGLHVENNLQYLTASENCSKKHLYWPEM